MTNQDEEFEESINIKITSSTNQKPSWPEETELARDAEPEFNIDNMQSIQILTQTMPNSIATNSRKQSEGEGSLN